MISLQNIHDNFVPVRLEFLSPVHIGSGEMLSPLEYQAMEEQSGQYFIYTIDFDGWINSLTPEEAKKVSSVFSQENLKQTWQYLQKRIDRNIFVKTKSKTTQEVYEKCKERLFEKNVSENDPAKRLMNPICEVAPVTAKPKYGNLYLGNFADKEQAQTPLPNWTFENLCKVCNTFYLKRFNKEYEKFYTQLHFVQARNFINSIWDKVQNENALLLRVGHYSHIECVTVENAEPKTRKSPKTKKPIYGTTRTLANGKYPFGWVLLHKCSVEEMEQGREQEEQAKQEFFANLQARKEIFIKAKQADYAEKQKALLEQQKEVEEQAKKVQEEERQKQAEQAQKEAEKLARKQAEQARKEAEEQRIASLSPEERLVELVLLKKAGKEEVLNVYERIDSLDNKIQVAEAIKVFWQKEKIWSGKLKENQKIRVYKITAILRTKIDCFAGARNDGMWRHVPSSHVIARSVTQSLLRL